MTFGHPVVLCIDLIVDFFYVYGLQRFLDDLSMTMFKLMGKGNCDNSQNMRWLVCESLKLSNYFKVLSYDDLIFWCLKFVRKFSFLYVIVWFVKILFLCICLFICKHTVQGCRYSSFNTSVDRNFLSKWYIWVWRLKWTNCDFFDQTKE